MNAIKETDPKYVNSVKDKPFNSEESIESRDAAQTNSVVMRFRRPMSDGLDESLGISKIASVP